LAPNEVGHLVAPNLAIPTVSSIDLQTKDEMVELEEKAGAKWQTVGESIIDNKDLSVALNLKEFRNLFRAFDVGAP
jgi:hypothetical protein